MVTVKRDGVLDTAGSHSVTFRTTLGDIVQSTVHGDGRYSATLVSSKAGEATVTATVDSVTLSQTAQLIFVEPASPTPTRSATPSASSSQSVTPSVSATPSQPASPSASAPDDGGEFSSVTPTDPGVALPSLDVDDLRGVGDSGTGTDPDSLAVTGISSPYTLTFGTAVLISLGATLLLLRRRRIRMDRHGLLPPPRS